MRRAWLLAIACGCGRIDFGTHSLATDATDAPKQLDGPEGVCSFDICDNFEAGISPDLWSVTGQVTLATGTAHGGSHSAHAMIPALAISTEGAAFIYETKTFATGSNPFWVRAWIRVVGAPVGSNGLELFSANQASAGPLGDFLFEHSDRVDVYSQFDDTSEMLLVMPASGVWTCVVWSVVPSSGGGSISLTGQLGTMSLSAITDGTPELANIALGLHFASTNVTSAQTPIEMWIDDVTIHHALLTCGG